MLTIGSRIEVNGQHLIVGLGGKLYQHNESVDAWRRKRQTQRVTKYRLVNCDCGQTFIAHDARMKVCSDCKDQAKRKRLAALIHRKQPHHVICQQCHQSMIAERSTKRFCSVGCKQAHYRQRLQTQNA
jgi:hypothetical protein